MATQAGSLPLQLEHVVLCDPLGRRKFPATQDAGKVSGDNAIVFGRIAGPLQGPHADLQRR